MKRVVKIKFFGDSKKIPFKAHSNDFAFDCYATSCEEIAPNVYKYGLGFALQCKKTFKDDGVITCFSVRPRSSVWKTGMVLSNCIGTVDDGYTGEISAVFYHVMPNMPKYNVGDRVCQLYFDKCHDIEFEEVDELEETERGSRGYGSTGNK